MDRYEMKQGILWENGEKVYGLGVSYYPSFLPTKYQVPEDGDRIGEMKKDFALIKESGFQFVRVAALGEVSVNEKDEVVVSTPFIDEMAREAERIGLGLSVRLQGYVVNLRGNTDYMMVNNRGEEMEKDWSAVMHSTMFHEGILRDNDDATRALAKHFSQFPSVISYQIYNEPHYAYNGIFDYHPAAQAAYRKHLVGQGVLAPEEAEGFCPPRDRLEGGTTKADWRRWRQFSTRALSDFLNRSAHCAKEADPSRETYTCLTATPTGNGAPVLGVNYYQVCEEMDSLGITSYINYDGSDFFSAGYQMDLAFSAAAAYHKTAWAVELDARTRMPSSKFYQETAAVIGAGFKGINYYEWRGDYPGEDTPEPDNCGLLWNDGRKTDGFDRNIELVKLIGRHTHRLAGMEPLLDGVAILDSEASVAWFDAERDTPNHVTPNYYVFSTLLTYMALRQAGVRVSLVRAEDLCRLGDWAKVLFVPAKEGLSWQEKKALEAFAQEHSVWVNDLNGTFGAVCVNGFREWNHPALNRTREEFGGGRQPADVLDFVGVRPRVETGHRNLFAQVLEDDRGYLILLVNNNPCGQSVPAHELSLELPAAVRSAKWITPREETALAPDGNRIAIPEVADAGCLYLEKA